jgi:hypothetical protein
MQLPTMSLLYSATTPRGLLAVGSVVRTTPESLERAVEGDEDGLHFLVVDNTVVQRWR